MAQSLQEVKNNRAKAKQSNMITDSDYVLRDKSKAEDASNTIDMTPPKVEEPKKVTRKTKVGE
jgi:hypothetical protein